MTIEYRIHEFARPVTGNALLATLAHYLGGMALDVSVRRPEDTGYFVESYLALLHGDPSNPAAGIEHEFNPNAGLADTRAFWGFLLDGEVFVHLRRPDEATLALARGFAEFVARYWGGQLETP